MQLFKSLKKRLIRLSDRNYLRELDIEVLLAKLERISNDIRKDGLLRRIGVISAMCYSPADPELPDVSFECCGCHRSYGCISGDDYAELITTIGEINSYGIFQVKFICLDCLIEMCQSGDYDYDLKDWDAYEILNDSYTNEYGRDYGIKDDNIDIKLLKWYSEQQKNISRNIPDINGATLFFKPADSEKARLTLISPYSHKLQTLLTLLQDKKIFIYEDHGSNLVVSKENKDVLSQLIGIKL